MAHIPNSARVKGLAAIEPRMRRLEAKGVLEYAQIAGVTSAQMPKQNFAADIMLYHRDGKLEGSGPRG